LSFDDYHNIFKKAIDSKICLVDYLVHYSPNLDTHVIAVRMTLSEGSSFTMRCASDGESLSATREDLENIDLGEFGRVEIVQLGKLDPASLSVCMDAWIKRVTLEIGDDKLKAARIECEDKIAFFSNVGDMLNFDEDLYRQMLIEEEWGVLTVVSYPT
jgi:hypothetical protein